MAFELNPARLAIFQELLPRYPTKQALTIPLLHLCQEQLGHISSEVVDYVAKTLGLATSEVQGVVTFYTMFMQKKVGRNVVWVCRTLSCDLRGGKAIQEHLEKRLGCHAGETTRDGQWTLKKAECLAGCGYGPMVQIDDRFFENLTPAALDAVMEAYEKGTPPAQAETAFKKNPAPAPSAAAPSTPSVPPTPSAPSTPSAPPAPKAS